MLGVLVWCVANAVFECVVWVLSIVWSLKNVDGTLAVLNFLYIKSYNYLRASGVVFLGVVVCYVANAVFEWVMWVLSYVRRGENMWCGLRGVDGSVSRGGVTITRAVSSVLRGCLELVTAAAILITAAFPLRVLYGTSPYHFVYRPITIWDVLLFPLFLWLFWCGRYYTKCVWYIIFAMKFY